MTIHIASCPSELETAQKIAEVLGCSVSEHPDVPADILIRWGNSRRGLLYHKVVNERGALKLCVDKESSLVEMARQNIPVPMFLNTPPCVARTRKHSRGEGLWLCLQWSDVLEAEREADYFVEYIPSRREFRVHVLGGKPILLQEKRLKDAQGSMYRWVRNDGNGWGFRTIKEINAEAVDIAVKSVAALGLDFGAVDIVESDFGKFYALEVNSAPTLRDSNAELWAEQLKLFMEAKFNV